MAPCCKTERHLPLNILYRTAILVLLLGASGCGQSSGERNSFLFTPDENGVSLSENGSPVFYYRKTPKTLTGEYICNHYIHPLFSLNGDTLTQEFPEDHPYHRGIFWSWHQLYLDTLSLGDEWIMEDISHEVREIRTSSGTEAARLILDVLWSSSRLETGKGFMEELTEITVHPLNSGIRMIDFEISLKALIKGISLGGSDDEKGYGGLCARLKLPDDLTFTAENGPVTPQTLQVSAGPWMDFSGTFVASAKQSGISILCHPSTPNYPAPWILRQLGSMQNIVFPGRNRVEVSETQPIILRYRLIVHEGPAEDLDLETLQADYEARAF